MKNLAILLFIALAISCNNAKTDTKLNGTWIPTKQEMGGMIMPDSLFQKESLVISDSTYIFTAESVDKGIVRCTDGKMDIYGKDGVNNGKHFTAIYKLENDQLTICYNLAGDSYPENYETKDRPMFFTTVFKKK